MKLWGYKFVAVFLLMLFAAASLPLFASAHCAATIRTSAAMASCDKPCCPAEKPQHPHSSTHMACERHCAIAVAPVAELQRPFNRDQAVAAVAGTSLGQRELVEQQHESPPLSRQTIPLFTSYFPLRI